MDGIIDRNVLRPIPPPAATTLSERLFDAIVWRDLAHMRNSGAGVASG
jgi:hypothetical protein